MFRPTGRSGASNLILAQNGANARGKILTFRKGYSIGAGEYAIITMDIAGSWFWAAPRGSLRLPEGAPAGGCPSPAEPGTGPPECQPAPPKEVTARVQGAYAHKIGKYFRMEYSLGVGYLQRDSKKYDKVNDTMHGDIKVFRYPWEVKRQQWFGPTSVRISLVWLLNKKTVKKEGGVK